MENGRPCDDAPMTTDSTRGFNVRLWRRFTTIAQPYRVSDERWRARGMLALLVVLLLGQTAFSVLFNHEAGEFTSALASLVDQQFFGAIFPAARLLPAQHLRH